jgi:hypothetical protein
MIEQQVSYLDQESRFVSHLQNIVDIAQDKQANLVIVGGIALRASMNKSVQFRRSNGTTPDIDMIGLGPNLTILHQTKKEINKYRKSQTDCPSVGIEFVKFSDHPQKIYKPSEVISGIRRDQHGEYYLTFRSVDQPIAYQTMDVFIRRYGLAKIPTLPQETIFRRYEVRMGYVKPKDKQKIDEFEQYIKDNGGDGLDPKLYESYYLFCQKVNKEHSNALKLTKLFWNLDLKLNGKISGASGLIYKTIGFFHH